jgi:hypothetical protein
MIPCLDPSRIKPKKANLIGCGENQNFNYVVECRDGVCLHPSHTYPAPPYIKLPTTVLLFFFFLQNSTYPS